MCVGGGSERSNDIGMRGRWYAWGERRVQGQKGRPTASAFEMKSVGAARRDCKGSGVGGGTEMSVGNEK